MVTRPHGSEVAHVEDYLYPGVMGGHSSQNVLRAIGRSVVDYDYLEFILWKLVDRRVDARNKLFDIVGLVIATAKYRDCFQTLNDSIQSFSRS